MDYLYLTGQLLSQEEQNEMEISIRLLGNGNYPAFYEKNKDIVWNILFLEEAEEVLVLDKSLAEHVSRSWESDNFSVYL